MKSLVVSWENFKIKINYSNKFKLYSFLKGYFEPWYNVEKYENIEKIDLIINLKNIEINEYYKNSKCDTIILRGTKDPLWTITAKKYIHNNIYFFDLVERNTVIEYDKFKKTFSVYTSESEDYKGTITYQEILILIIDSIIIKYAENLGAILLHAASYKTEDGVYLILGERGAGKTTVLLSAMLDKKNYCISNDRCLLLKKNSEYVIYGLPYTINIRRESLEMYKRMNIKFVPNWENSQSKIVFTHKRIIENNIKSGRLKKIFLPNCKLSHDTMIERITSKELEKNILKCCFSYNNVKFPDWHQIFDIKYDDKYIKDTIHDIAKIIPAFLLNWGYDLPAKICKPDFLNIE